jgi:hypothetical protein
MALGSSRAYEQLGRNSASKGNTTTRPANHLNLQAIGATWPAEEKGATWSPMVSPQHPAWSRARNSAPSCAGLFIVGGLGVHHSLIHPTAGVKTEPALDRGQQLGLIGPDEFLARIVSRPFLLGIKRLERGDIKQFVLGNECPSEPGD